MKPYLVVCYVDLYSKDPSRSSIVSNIVDLIAKADVVESALTLMFKGTSSDSHACFFNNDVSNFINDPLGILDLPTDEDVDDEDYLSEDDGSLEYEENFMPLYLYFVSSKALQTTGEKHDSSLKSLLDKSKN